MKTIPNSNEGFTLIELMVALAITSILLAGIYTTYITQLKSHLTQQLLVEMQQSLRGSMQLMEREIRMAGYDPEQTAGAGITTMLATSFRFTMDLNGDGDLTDPTTTPPNKPDPNEDVRYGINTLGSLGRETGGAGGLQPLAEFTDALNFVYLDKDSNVTNDPLVVKSVQVTIVSRSSQTVPVMFFRQTDNRVYKNQQGAIVLPARNDNFRRMAVTTDIKCRNL